MSKDHGAVVVVWINLTGMSSKSMKHKERGKMFEYQIFLENKKQIEKRRCRETMRKKNGFYSTSYKDEESI